MDLHGKQQWQRGHDAETLHVDLFTSGSNRVNGQRFDQPDNAYGHSVAVVEQDLAYGGRQQVGLPSQRKKSEETGQQSTKSLIITPARQLIDFEAVGQQSPFRVSCPGADQWQLDVIGEKSESIEQNLLLALRAGQHRVQLVDDQGSRFDELQKIPGDATQLGDVVVVARGGDQSIQ